MGGVRTARLLSCLPLFLDCCWERLHFQSQRKLLASAGSAGLLKAQIRLWPRPPSLGLDWLASACLPLPTRV